jgi:hypothetical protein
MRSGVCSARPTVARPICANGSSSWPTPNSGNFNDGEEPETFSARARRLDEKHHNSNGAGTPLAIAAKLWPTPNVPSQGGSGLNTMPTDRKEQIKLHHVAAMWPTPHGFQAGNGPDGNEFSTRVRREMDSWPTPRAEDSESAGNHPGAMDSLTVPVRLWQTPAADSFRSRSGDRSDEMGLDQQARLLWATPANLDWRDGRASAETLERNSRPLNEQATSWPTPGTEETGSTPEKWRERRQKKRAALMHSEDSGLQDRATEKAGPPCRRVLNPRFVEMLQGWPTDWTDCERSVTGWFQWWRQWRSYVCENA